MTLKTTKRRGARVGLALANTFIITLPASAKRAMAPLPMHTSYREGAVDRCDRYHPGLCKRSHDGKWIGTMQGEVRADAFTCHSVSASVREASRSNAAL
jgi:hypothetical protein